MLDLSILENALAPLSKIGADEITFDAEGISVTLRPLIPEEEVEVQRYAQEALSGHQNKDGTDRYAALDFVNRFRKEALAYAIIAVGDLDLHEVEYVATGEMTQSGKPVRIPKHVAMRQTISKWTRTMLQVAFAKYGDLMSKIEEKTMKLVEYDPADLDAEIQRVEKRLSELKAEKERRLKGDVNLTAEHVKAINNMEQAESQKTQEAVREYKPAPPPATPPPVTSEPFFREMAGTMASRENEWATFEDIPSAADLDDTPKPPALEQPAERKPVIPENSPPPSRNPVASPPAPTPEVMDSFGDIDDEKVLQAEQERLLEARRRMAASRRAQNAEEMLGATPRRTPPHLRGTVVAEQELQPGISGGGIRAASLTELASMGIPPHLTAGDLTPEAEAQLVARKTGASSVQVQPTETLSDRGRGRGPQEVLPVNQVGSGNESRNERFRPPR
jgi:hypothetical protein